jgi:hypothetical protein
VAISRFNAGRLLAASSQFEILYFAENSTTAEFEIGALFGNPFKPGGSVPNPRLGYTMLNVQVVLHDVCDLTDVAGAQGPLGTTAQELTGDWEHYQTRGPTTSVSAPTGIAPTQMLGEALFKTGIEGFRAISAKIACNRTLMVFPQNLQTGSSVVFRNAGGTVVHQLP